MDHGVLRRITNITERSYGNYGSLDLAFGWVYLWSDYEVQKIMDGSLCGFLLEIGWFLFVLVWRGLNLK